MGEKRKEIEINSKECEELKKIQARMESNEVDMIAKGESFNKAITDCNKRIDHWEGELLKLRNAEENDDEYDFSINKIEDVNQVKDDNEEETFDDNLAVNCYHRVLSHKTGKKKS